MNPLRRAAWWLRTPRAQDPRRTAPPPAEPGAGPMHVACAADENYVPHAAAMLHSVLMNSGGLPVHVHFLHDPALAPELLQRLRRMVESRGGRFDAIPVAPDLVAGLHVTREISRPAWYRSFLPALRPQLERVLYLDCDLIAADSLRPLWETPLDGHLVAAVQNVIEASLVTRHHALGIPADQTYFNSGVLLMNLAAMRVERSPERVLAHARQHGDRLIWVDQDSLNLVFGARCRFLHPRWNTQTSMFYWTEAEDVIGAERVAEALAHPAIVHFEGPDFSKPWNYLCKHPYRRSYLRHRRDAGWEDPVFEARNWRRALLRLLPMRVIPHALMLARSARARWRQRRFPRLPHLPDADMLARLKRLIKASPIGPLAVWLYRRTPKRKPFESLNERYDRETVEVMQRTLRPDSCCVDVGAHQGTILEQMLRLAPRGRHFAFEPLPHLAAELARRFPAVQVVAAAVGDRAGTAEFVHVQNDPAYSGLRPRVYDRPDPVLQRIQVQVMRIDDVIATDTQVALMKLDIEGGEYHALRGATATIRRCRPVLIFEAGQKSTGQYGIDPETLYRFITAELGYKLSTMQRWLAGRLPYGEAEYAANWREGSDFYFIAYPA